jgi:hypothetical protein
MDNKNKNYVDDDKEKLLTTIQEIIYMDGK